MALILVISTMNFEPYSHQCLMYLHFTIQFSKFIIILQSISNVNIRHLLYICCWLQLNYHYAWQQELNDCPKVSLLSWIPPQNLHFDQFSQKNLNQPLCFSWLFRIYYPSQGQFFSRQLLQSEFVARLWRRKCRSASCYETFIPTLPARKVVHLCVNEVLMSNGPEQKYVYNYWTRNLRLCFDENLSIVKIVHNTLTRFFMWSCTYRFQYVMVFSAVDDGSQFWHETLLHSRNLPFHLCNSSSIGKFLIIFKIIDLKTGNS